MDHKKSPIRRQKRQSKVLEDNFWDCSVCTYRNTAEAFKCLMCDVRKGWYRVCAHVYVCVRVCALNVCDVFVDGFCCCLCCFNCSAQMRLIEKLTNSFGCCIERPQNNWDFPWLNLTFQCRMQRKLRNRLNADEPHLFLFGCSTYGTVVDNQTIQNIWELNVFEWRDENQ